MYSTPLTFVDFWVLGHIWTIKVLGLVGSLVLMTLGHCKALGLPGFRPIMGFEFHLGIWAILGFWSHWVGPWLWAK